MGKPTRQKIIQAFHKQLILHFLRARQNEIYDFGSIKWELFEMIHFKEVQDYCLQLISDKRASKWGEDKIANDPNSNEFIERGGYVYEIFRSQTKTFDSELFAEAYRKDLLLNALECNPSGQWSLDAIHGLFPKLEISAIRHYRDIFERAGYIRKHPATFQYLDADEFLTSGGYLGKYLQEVFDEEYHGPDRTKRMNKWKRTVEYRLWGLKYYLPWIIIAVLLVLFFLVRFNVIPKDQARNVVKWALGLI